VKAFFLVNSISGGGAERVVNNLAQGFAKAGVSTFLILLYSDSQISNKANNLQIISLIQGVDLSSIKKILVLPRLVNELKKVMVSLDYDSAHDLFTSHLPLSNYVGWLAGIKEHFAVIHNTYSKLYSKRWTYPFLARIHNNKKLVFVSKGIMEDFFLHFNSYPCDSRQIYNPFDFDEIRALSGKSSSPHRRRFILHVGRFTTAKRHDILLDAFSNISDSDIDLLLLGDGELKNEIVEKIKNLGLEKRVHLKGWLENPFPYLRHAELLVLSSDYEGLPTVLIEALVLSTPVVSTDCPSGPSEILTSELSKYLTPVSNSGVLAKKIDHALTYYPEITDTLIEKFAIKNIISEYIKLKEYKN
jgi:glycosyltransferase involved in cell wall biosynthesis